MLRNWANRDNGSYYQIGNKNLSKLEMLGYLLYIAALIIFILHYKVGFEETWIGWSFLIVGFVLNILGAPSENIN
jgi:hypothetical protein